MITGARCSTALLLCSFTIAACKRAPEPLAGERAQCRALAAEKQLRPGLGIEECAARIKAAADAADPAARAGALLDRAQSVIAANKTRGALAQRREVAGILAELQGLGRPAVPAMLHRLSTAVDPDLRIAVARALVVLCSDDCGERRWDCIVPAMLEGTTDDKPPEVRLSATRGLARCTQQPFGDDAAAFRRWYADQAAATASR